MGSQACIKSGLSGRKLYRKVILTGSLEDGEGSADLGPRGQQEQRCGTGDPGQGQRTHRLEVAYEKAARWTGV